MSNVVIGAIRTITPMVIGWVITVLALPDGLSEQLEGAFFVIVSGFYYLVARWLAEKWDWAGWLLGFNSEPVYEYKEKVYDIADE